MGLNKGILALLVLSTSALSTYAQLADSNRYDYVNPEPKQITEDGNNVISFGFGIGGYYPYKGTVYTENPNLAFSYDNVTFKHVGPGSINLGGLLAYQNIYSSYADANNGYDYVQHWNYYIIGARVSYHLHPIPEDTKIETYAGVMLGYYITNFSVNSTDPNYTEQGDPGYYLTSNNYPNFIALGVYAGIRSWFNKHESVWLEVGYGYSSFEFGLSYRI